MGRYIQPHQAPQRLRYRGSALGGPVEDFFKNVIDPIIGKSTAGVQAALDERTSAAIQDLLKTKAGQDILLVVEERAKSGVEDQIKSTLPWLAGLTVGGGVLGGMVLKGKVGAIVGAAILGISLWKLLDIGNPLPAPASRIPARR